MSTEVTGPATLDDPAVAAFGSQLRQRRQQRRWSQRELGLATHFSREYVALIERGQRRPTAAFVEQAEAALEADGALLRIFAELERARLDTPPRRRTRRRSPQAVAKAALALRRSASHTTAQGRDVDAVRPALDCLLDSVRADLNTDQASGQLDELERRHADLLTQANGRLPLVDLVCAAALAVQDCLALLDSPMLGRSADRAAGVMAQFARLAASGLDALGLVGDARGWYRLAASVCRVDANASDPVPLTGRDTCTASEPADPTPEVDCAGLGTARNQRAGCHPTSPLDVRSHADRRPACRSRLRRSNAQLDKPVSAVRCALPTRPPRRPTRAPPSLIRAAYKGRLPR